MKASTALHLVGYPLAVAVLTRWVPVVRQRRLAWFVAEEAAVAAIVAGWAIRHDIRAAAINGAWGVSAAVWYTLAGRPAKGRP